jgi:beta-glucosidase
MCIIQLPFTFYKSVNNLPAFTNYNMSNRTYKYFKREVLYPFGHGLSYAQFEYSDLQLPENINPREFIISISGKQAGFSGNADTATTQVLSGKIAIGEEPLKLALN